MINIIDLENISMGIIIVSHKGCVFHICKKKLINKIIYMKSSILAATYILKGESQACHLFVAGFFCAYVFTIRGSVPPCNSVMGLLPLRCKSTGKAGPFFSGPKFNVCKMTYTEKELAVSEVSISYTPAEERIQIKCSRTASFVLRYLWDPQLLNVQEQFYALFLNRANEVLCWRLIGTGNGKSCILDLKLIGTIVCNTLAHAVIIAHNHPSGTLRPSGSDRAVTYKLERMLELFDVELIDHLIITRTSYYSFADKGLIHNHKY